MFYYYSYLKNININVQNIVAKKNVHYFPLTSDLEILFFQGPARRNTNNCGVYSIMFVQHDLKKNPLISYLPGLFSVHYLKWLYYVNTGDYSIDGE